VQSLCAHHVSPRAEKIDKLTLSRCQGLLQGFGARRRLFAELAWPRRTLLWHDYERASRKPVPLFPSSPRHHVSPRAEQIVNLVLSRSQRLSKGVDARRDFSKSIPYSRGSVRSHSGAGIGLGTADKYLQCTTAKWPEHCATHNERRRGQRTGHLDLVSATHNERRRGQRPKPMPGITHVPLYLMRPAFALFSACLIRQQTEKHCPGLRFRCRLFVREARAFSLCS
jgi:hypothetical protein